MAMNSLANKPWLRDTRLVGLEQRNIIDYIPSHCHRVSVSQSTRSIGNKPSGRRLWKPRLWPTARGAWVREWFSTCCLCHVSTQVLHSWDAELCFPTAATGRGRKTVIQVSVDRPAPVFLRLLVSMLIYRFSTALSERWDPIWRQNFYLCNEHLLNYFPS